MTHEEAWSKVYAQVQAGDVEETIVAIADWMAVEKAAQTHPEVIACLESAEEGLRHAALDFYVSTK